MVIILIFLADQICLSFFTSLFSTYLYVHLCDSLISSLFSSLFSSLLCTQVYHLSKASARFLHEKANNTYSVPAAFLAELTTTSIGLLTFIPGTAVTYFMMGFKNEAYPFMMFVYWMVSTQASCMKSYELYCTNRFPNDNLITLSYSISFLICRVRLP